VLLACRRPCGMRWGVQVGLWVAARRLTLHTPEFWKVFRAFAAIFVTAMGASPLPQAFAEASEN